MKSLAERNFTRRLAITMAVYLVLTFISTSIIHRWHPSRPAVYGLALLPTLAVVKLIHVVALYVQEQKDEYLRSQLVRSLLFGLTATLAANSFSDFLRAFDHGRGLPPFTLFSICWAVTGFAQGIQSHKNRVRDEEPTA